MPLTEQEVLSLMSNASDIEPIADLLTALGYPDVAKELRTRWDEMDRGDEDFFH